MGLVFSIEEWEREERVRDKYNGLLCIKEIEIRNLGNYNCFYF